MKEELKSFGGHVPALVVWKYKLKPTPRVFAFMSERSSESGGVSAVQGLDCARGPQVQPAHGGCEEKRDDIGWLDGLSDQALAPSPHIFMCPSCLWLSCDPCPTCPTMPVLPGDTQGSAWPRQHLCAAGFTDKCKLNQPPKPFQSKGRRCCVGRAHVGTAAPSQPGSPCPQWDTEQQPWDCIPYGFWIRLQK